MSNTSVQESPSTTNLPSKKKSDGEPTNSTCRAAVSRGQRSMTGCVPRRRYGKRKMHYRRSVGGVFSSQ